MSEEKPVRQVGVKIVKADNFGETPTVFVESQKPIEKSDKSEQLSMVNAVNASEWITHPIDMRGLKELVDNSTILPQCIRAYKSNIAGFGISVGYREDYEEETTEMQAEYSFFLADNADAVIDAGTDKVIFLHHATGKNAGFDLFAFSIADSKTYSWMFMLIAHRKAPFIVGVAAGTVKHPQATFDYSFLVVKVDYICHGFHRSNRE